MKKYSAGSFVLMIITIMFSLSACSQKLNVVKARAFVKTSVAGTVQVDDYNRTKNRGIEKVHLIFVETQINKPAPIWKTAWVEQKSYSIKTVEVEQENVTLGKKEENGENVILKAAKGNRLWQLVLTSNETASPKNLSETIKKNPITLSGVWRNKPFTYPISKEEKLETFFAQ